MSGSGGGDGYGGAGGVDGVAAAGAAAAASAAADAALLPRRTYGRTHDARLLAALRPRQRPRLTLPSTCGASVWPRSEEGWHVR